MTANRCTRHVIERRTLTTDDSAGAPVRTNLGATCATAVSRRIAERTDVFVFCRRRRELPTRKNGESPSERRFSGRQRSATFRVFAFLTRVPRTHRVRLINVSSSFIFALTAVPFYSSVGANSFIPSTRHNRIYDPSAPSLRLGFMLASRHFPRRSWHVRDRRQQAVHEYSGRRTFRNRKWKSSRNNTSTNIRST